MKFEKLRLKNFQSYDQAAIEFEDGLTLVHGDNGAGKTTLIRAIYMALFQGQAKSEIGTGYELLDFIKDGEEEAEVELTFRYEGDPYTVTWVIAKQEGDDGPVGRTRSNRTTLSSPALDTEYSGPSDVRDVIEDLLDMDAEAYANSTYAQQARLTRLIEATDSQRESILDNLLGLDAPETYADRLGDVTSPIEDFQEDLQARRRQLSDEISDVDESELQSELQSLQETIGDLQEREGELDEAVADAQEQVQKLDQRIDEYREAKERQGELEDKIRDKKERIRELRGEIDDCQATINECEEVIERKRERLQELNEDVPEYDLTDESEAAEALNEFETAREEAAAAVERKAAAVDQARNEVSRLEEELDSHRDELRTACLDHKQKLDTVADARDEAEQAKDELSEREAERDEAAGEFLDTAISEVEDIGDAVDAKRESLDKRRQDLELEENELEQKQEQAETDIARIERELETAREERQTIRERLDTDVDDPETAFEEALSRADDLGDGFDIDVAPETLDSTLTGELPETRSEVLDELADAFDDELSGCIEQARAETRIEDLEALEGGEWPIDGGDIGATHDYSDALDDLRRVVEESEQATDSASKAQEDARSQLTTLDELTECLLTAASFRALAGVTADIEAYESELEERKRDRDELAEQLTGVREELDTVRQQLRTGESVAEAVERAEGAAEKLQNRREELHNAEEAADDVVEEISEAADAVGEKHDELSEAREELEGAIDDHEKAETTLESKEANERIADKAVECHESISDREGEKETQREAIETREGQIDDLQSDVASFQDDLTDAEEVTEGTSLDELQEQNAKAEKLRQQVETERANVREEIREKDRKQERVEQNLEDLRERRATIQSLDEKAEWAEDIENELTGVEATYEEVQTEMRNRVLGRLNKYANDIFGDLYQSESYNGLRIGEDYSLELIRADDTTRDPKKASGGESVLATIALRAAVYHVLADQHAEGGEGLPPLVLDEPTSHLDDTHVDQIEGVIENIQTWDVPQVIVVSHRNGLVHDAPHEIEVTKDEATDTSTLNPDYTSSHCDEAAGDD
ncbi:AAA family ATPase [Halorubrum sodomense]|uniref:DNA repair exonuclease SbcCD ATPase subunit n=1 Tax=Halorubrum sodomense TaxID=35743 RepID=A0A1I6HPS4_HALSD|nr:AAA family ATPase [Halorubrum sodomense]SFR56384.1 DNA repair exonuclease SbcCD ATPase subunit [Halorubrum sodomense]